MKLLYADETSLDPDKHEFFVYGGLSIPADHAESLHAGIERIREEGRIPSDYLLKFNPGPSTFSHSEFIDLKKKVIELAVENKCTFLTTLSMHKILTSVDQARRGEINRIALHFNSLLNQTDDTGLVLVDRFSDKQIDSHLREKFSVGLKGMPYCESMRLNRILGFHYSAIGQSHFPSVIDILMGSIRYTVDAFTKDDEKGMATGRTLLEQMKPLFHVSMNGKVSEISINFTPKIIKSTKYLERYQKLKDFFSSCGVEPTQEITSYRTY